MICDEQVMCAGVFIDDAGTPGVRSQSKYLHSNRKSWAAVVVPPDVEGDLRNALRIFLDGVRQDYGAGELHFTDIYSGRGPYKDVPIQERFELIDLMASLFENLELPIFFQTSSPEFLAEARERYGIPTGKVGWFSLDNHEHFGLLILCAQVAPFIRKHRLAFPNRLPVAIDEGLVKKGGSIKLPGFDDVFANAELRFLPSDTCAYLQLADFAAFVIGRSQWLLGKGDLKERDHRFLETISADRLNIINLPRAEFDLKDHTTEDFDELLQEDRLFKGFKEP